MSTRAEAIASSLRQRLLTALHLGTLKPGDRLPSVRALARQHRADVRVILAAYRVLAGEGLVHIRRRSGMEVAPAAVAAVARLPQVGRWVVDFLTAGLPCGLGPSDVLRQARRCLDTVTLRAACVECNLDQIHALCFELDKDYGIQGQGIEVDALGSPAARDVLARADLVVTTRFHEQVVRESLGPDAPPLVLVALNPGFRAELARVLAVEPIHFLCTDPRFAAKLLKMFDGRGDVRPVVLGQDPVDRLRANAYVYAMPRAVERLPAGWHPKRLLTAARVFSIETGRELIAHIVRINLEAAARSSPEGSARSEAGHGARVAKANATVLSGAGMQQLRGR